MARSKKLPFLGWPRRRVNDFIVVQVLLGHHFQSIQLTNNGNLLVISNSPLMQTSAMDNFHKLEVSSPVIFVYLTSLTSDSHSQYDIAPRQRQVDTNQHFRIQDIIHVS